MTTGYDKKLQALESDLQKVFKVFQPDILILEYVLRRSYDELFSGDEEENDSLIIAKDAYLSFVSSLCERMAAQSEYFYFGCIDDTFQFSLRNFDNDQHSHHSWDYDPDTGLFYFRFDFVFDESEFENLFV